MSEPLKVPTYIFNELVRQKGRLREYGINPELGDYITLPSCEKLDKYDIKPKEIVERFLSNLSQVTIPDTYPETVSILKSVIQQTQEQSRPYDVEEQLILAGLRGPQPMFTNYFVESAQRRFHFAIQGTQGGPSHLDAFCICNHWASLAEESVDAALTQDPTPSIATAVETIRQRKPI